MSKKYLIQWKSRVNGRMGKGTKLFSREEAERLAGELNREYPDIQHEVVDAEGQAESPAVRPGSAASHEGHSAEEAAPSEPQVLSFQE